MLRTFKCEITDDWPKIEKNKLMNIDFAVQVNGKTRDIIQIKEGLTEKQVNESVMQKSKAKKYLENKKIVKTIFVSNKIINYILEIHDKIFIFLVL